MTKSSSQDPSISDHPTPSDPAPERSEDEILLQYADSPEEEAEISALLRDIHKPESSLSPLMRKIGWATAILSFATLGILTAVMVRDVRLSTRMYGPQTLTPGGYASYRISVFNPQKTIFFNDIQADLWLLGPQKKLLLYRGSTTKKVLIANVKIPTWAPGAQYQLRLSVTCPAGRESFTRSVTLQSSSQRISQYTVATNKRVWKFAATTPKSPYQLELFAENRAPVADLSSVFWLRVQERPPVTQPPAIRATPPSTPSSQPSSRPGGVATKSQGASRSVSRPGVRFPTLPEPSRPRHRPQQPLNPFAQAPLVRPLAPTKPATWGVPRSPVSLTIKHGRTIQDGLTTNALGMVHFPYIAQMFDERWSIQVKGKFGTYTFHSSLKPEGYQLVLDVPQVIIAPQKKLFLRVDGLHPKSELHIDLTQHGQRIWSVQSKMSGGRAALTIPLPPHIHGLIGVQVYTEFYFPGEVHDEHLVYIGKPDRKKIVTALKQHLTQRGDVALTYTVDELNRQLPTTTPVSEWAKPVFSLLKARFVPPSMYYNSANDRLRRLRGYQRRFRKGTILFMIGLSGCVVAGIFLWLFVGYQRDQQRMRDVAEETGVEVVKGRGLSILFLFLVLLSAIFAAIILLFWVMQWTYDKI